MTTPDQDGWIYWNPGDPLPTGNVWQSQWRAAETQEWLPLGGPPGEWKSWQRRYKLESPPNISDIRVGDMVVLGPMRVAEVGIGRLGSSVSVDAGWSHNGNAAFDIKRIERVIPAPKSPLTEAKEAAKRVRAMYAYSGMNDDLIAVTSFIEGLDK